MKAFLFDLSREGVDGVRSQFLGEYFLSEPVLERVNQLLVGDDDEAVCGVSEIYVMVDFNVFRLGTGVTSDTPGEIFEPVRFTYNVVVAAKLIRFNHWTPPTERL